MPKFEEFPTGYPKKTVEGVTLDIHTMLGERFREGFNSGREQALRDKAKAVEDAASAAYERGVQKERDAQLALQVSIRRNAYDKGVRDASAMYGQQRYAPGFHNINFDYITATSNDTSGSYARGYKAALEFIAKRVNDFINTAR